MCGIAGFVGAGDRSDIERMAGALAHRGPDGEGFHIDAKAAVFLGHRRLAVVDLATGDQPMWSADGQVGVVFNGEIYNHVELRAQLQAKGHQFQTDHSDTEVLIHGYREWGEELPRRLNGMFAFAVYDRPRRRLFLARDRFGEKPLYYTQQKGVFGFASELTALAAHPSIDRTMNVRSLQKFFAYGYLPAPNAMLNGVSKLPGGHWMSFDIASRALRVSPYWQFSLQHDEGLSDKDEPALVEECAGLLSQAARRRLMSERPLGVFLSGGLDSSVVLASLAGHMPASQLRTFTIGFTEPTFDESPYARTVADHLGTEHNERLLDMARAQALMPQVLARLDEPLGDASILPTYLLSAFAREHVTVALSGDGGDELFAGYDPFAALGPAKAYRALVPGPIHKGMRRLADFMPISHANMSLDFKVKRALMGLSYPPKMWLPVWMAPVDPADLKDLFEAPLEVEDVYSEALSLWERGGKKSNVDKALEFFTQYYLQDDILAKSDRASMMSSLETRAVFLDNDLAEFCQRLPNRFKYRNGERKYLLKQVARSLLPSSIVDRKKKGFGIPLAKWLREATQKTPLAPVPGVKTSYAEAAFADHRAGRADRRLFLWSWHSMQSFAERLQG